MLHSIDPNTGNRNFDCNSKFGGTIVIVVVILVIIMIIDLLTEENNSLKYNETIYIELNLVKEQPIH